MDVKHLGSKAISKTQLNSFRSRSRSRRRHGRAKSRSRSSTYRSYRSHRWDIRPSILCRRLSYPQCHDGAGACLTFTPMDILDSSVNLMFLDCVQPRVEHKTHDIQWISVNKCKLIRIRYSSIFLELCQLKKSLSIITKIDVYSILYIFGVFMKRFYD